MLHPVLPSSRRGLAALTLSALALTGSLTACSSGSPTSSTTGGPSAAAATADAPGAKDLLEKAKAATAAAKSGRVRATVTDSGATVTIVSATTRDGKDGTGTIDQKSKGVVKYIISGASVYLSGDEVFWKGAGAPADQATTLAKSGKWIKTPVAGAKDLTGSVNFPTLVAGLFTDTGKINSVTQKVDSDSIDGVDCWVLSDRFGGNDAKFFFDKKSGLPVRVSVPDKDAPQTMDFDQWNAVPAAKAPAASAIFATS